MEKDIPDRTGSRPRLRRAGRGSAITGIVSFGDSLSDVGNFYAATGGASPPAAYGYDSGRFTNGMNWVEYLAKDLGVAAPTASVNGGTDYAYGGAMTGTGYTIVDLPRGHGERPEHRPARSTTTSRLTPRRPASFTRSGAAPTMS